MPFLRSWPTAPSHGATGGRAGARKVLRIITALCACALIAACSTVRMGYENLPTLAYWWLDDYLDFDGAQSLQVRAALDQWQAAHRREELEPLAGLLAQAQKGLAGDITAQEACQMGDEVRTRLRAAAALAEAPAARIALSLGPQQIDALAQRYARSNDDYRREWLVRTPAKRQAERYSAQRKRYEDIYGRLDDAQRAQLKAAVARSRFDSALFDAERRRRQAEVLALLRGWQQQPVSEEAARAAIAVHIDRIQQAPPGPWREQQQALWQEGCSDFAALHATTTPAQRARAVLKMKTYAQDVQALQQAVITPRSPNAAPAPPPTAAE